MGDRHGSRLGVTVVVVAASAVLLLHAATYLPFFSDDAFISLRYAQRFLEGRGLTWNDGERVEGYSNLLWILGCSALGALGIDLVVAARVLGAALSIAAVGALAWAYRSTPLTAAAAGAVLAVSGPMAVWAYGGMEQPLLAALWAWAIARMMPLVDSGSPPGARGLHLTGLLLGLLCLTRPDAALLGGTAVIGLVLARRWDREALRAGATIAAWIAAFWLGQTAFRVAYYGAWVPNPALAKVAISGARVAAGLRYLVGGFPYVASAWAIVVALLVLGKRAAGPARAVFLAVPLAAWCSYVAVIGGDIFPGRRQLVPVVILLAFLVAESSTELLTRKRDRAALWVAVAIVLGLALAQPFDRANYRARRELWEWDGEVVGKFLDRAFGEARPLIAVDAAGCLPYYSKLPAVDMLGLNDAYLARHRPPDFGRGWMGHELGSGTYVLSREPDLVLFGLPRNDGRPLFRSGRELVADPRFLETYRPIRVLGDDPYPVDTVVFVRFEGGKLGIGRTESRVEIPGWFLAGPGTAAARLDDAGRLGVPVSGDAPAAVSGVPVNGGTWMLQTEAHGAPVVAQVSWPGGQMRGSGAIRLELPQGGIVPLTISLIAPPGAVTHVSRLVLERAPS